jgi:hypothetical protein
MRRFALFGARGAGENDDAHSNNNTSSIGNTNSSDNNETNTHPPTPGDTGSGRKLFRNFPATVDSSRGAMYVFLTIDFGPSTSTGTVLTHFQTLCF